MRDLIALKDLPPPWLQDALHDFEGNFTYPLGSSTFSIEHGKDYGRFFRSLGEACTFVAAESGVVSGAISLSIREIVSPDEKVLKAAYICDIKLREEARAGRLLLSLSRLALDWGKERASVAYGIVMDGTAVTPLSYSGRLGIPAFKPVAKIAVLRLEALACMADEKTQAVAKESQARAVFSQLSPGFFATPLAFAGQRSQMQPTWLALPDSSACGCLEDTRRAKRLVDNRGEEMLSAHLGSLAYSDTASGAHLIRQAASLAKNRGYPALFLAVPLADSPTLCAALKEFSINVATATIFACGITAGDDWLVNSSEI